MTKELIKPCPFCGTVPTKVESLYYPYSLECVCYAVRCPKEDCTGNSDPERIWQTSRKNAIKAWNTRKYPNKVYVVLEGDGYECSWPIAVLTDKEKAEAQKLKLDKRIVRIEEFLLDEEDKEK